MLVLAVLYAAATTVLFVFGLNQLWLARRHRAQGGLRARPAEVVPEEWPVVTVQLPLYNERFVVERLIDAVARFDYPADKLEIQVLDDSTDDTGHLAAARVAYWKSRGVQIEHVARAERIGYKAGALAHGLQTAKGELIAIFDADFLPHPDFLKRTVPVLAADTDLGLVQARWGHLNDTESVLTRAQSALLDSHFVIEQDVRNGAGLFMNFNGTAGVWRRACIDDAGGWQHDTLTEDLDLSYRAQMCGWKFRYLADTVAPAELPQTVAVWRRQQFRWSKGSVETAYKLLPAFLRSPLSVGVKVQGMLHLGGFFVFPAILIAVLLHAPLLVAREIGAGPGNAYFAAMGLGILAFTGVLFAHVSAQRALYPDWKKRIRYEPIFLAAALGLAVNNTRGLLEAVVGHRTPFLRTPKAGEKGGHAAYAPRPDSVVLWVERGLALYSLAGLIALVATGAWVGVGFQMMFVGGFGMLGFYDNIRSRAAAARPARVHHVVSLAKETVQPEVVHVEILPKARAA